MTLHFMAMVKWNAIRAKCPMKTLFLAMIDCQKEAFKGKT